MLGSTPLEQDFVMGGDLSASRRTAWFSLQGGTKFSIDMGCPIGVVGTVSIEVCNHGVTGTAGAALPAAKLPGLTQPTGAAAWDCLVDSVETSAAYAAVVWTPTSGGAGNYLTNGAHEVGTGPRIVVKD